MGRSLTAALKTPASRLRMTCLPCLKAGHTISMAVVPAARKPVQGAVFALFTGLSSLRQPFNLLVFHVRAGNYDETAPISGEGAG